MTEEDVTLVDSALLRPLPRILHTLTLSTLKVVLGPAVGAWLAEASLAVPAAMEIPKVPSPVMPEIVTVRVDVPEPDTAMVPLAVPV